MREGTTLSATLRVIRDIAAWALVAIAVATMIGIGILIGAQASAVAAIEGIGVYLIGAGLWIPVCLLVFQILCRMGPSSRSGRLYGPVVVIVEAVMLVAAIFATAGGAFSVGTMPIPLTYVDQVIVSQAIATSALSLVGSLAVLVSPSPVEGTAAAVSADAGNRRGAAIPVSSDNIPGSSRQEGVADQGPSADNQTSAPVWSVDEAVGQGWLRASDAAAGYQASSFTDSNDDAGSGDHLR